MKSTSSRIAARALPALGLAGALSLGAASAGAHLIPARHGTVNVVGAAVYTVMSVPASALPAADDDHDGVLSAEEFTRHEEDLRAEIDRRLVILDGSTAARTVRVDLLLSPDHEAQGAGKARADQIVALKHAELGAAPSDLRVRCDLFGGRAEDREITVTATRRGAAGPEKQVVVLRPEAAEVALFAAAPEAAPAVTSAAMSEVGRAPRGVMALATLAAGAAAMLAMLRARRARV